MTTVRIVGDPVFVAFQITFRWFLGSTRDARRFNHWFGSLGVARTRWYVCIQGAASLLVVDSWSNATAHDAHPCRRIVLTRCRFRPNNFETQLLLRLCIRRIRHCVRNLKLLMLAWKWQMHVVGGKMVWDSAAFAVDLSAFSFCSPAYKMS